MKSDELQKEFESTWDAYLNIEKDPKANPNVEAQVDEALAKLETLEADIAKAVEAEYQEAHAEALAEAEKSLKELEAAGEDSGTDPSKPLSKGQLTSQKGAIAEEVSKRLSEKEARMRVAKEESLAAKAGAKEPSERQ